MAEVTQRDFIRVSVPFDDGTTEAFNLVAIPSRDHYSGDDWRFLVGEEECREYIAVYASEIPHYIELFQAMNEYYESKKETN